MCTRDYLIAIVGLFILSSCQTQQKMQAAVSEMTLLRKANTDLTDKNTALQAELAAKDQEIASLTKQVTALKTEVGELKKIHP